MKKKTVVILITMLFVMVSWSPLNETNVNTYDKVKLRTIEVSGMTYMVAYGENDNVGVAVVNVTLDSLKCAQLKRTKNEKIALR